MDLSCVTNPLGFFNFMRSFTKLFIFILTPLPSPILHVMKCVDAAEEGTCGCADWYLHRCRSRVGRLQVCVPTLPPFALASLTLTLLVICNCSMLNPGPRGLSVLYNNVRGLVSPGHLSSTSPPLNMNKMLEIQDYVYNREVDIVIMNETWLKPKIESTAIFPTNFKVVRVDRSSHSHPYDPHSNRYREHGGGVLIAHREDINISSFRFSKPNSQAELLTLVITLPSGTRLCLSTFYRVGTLCEHNFNEFKRHFDCLFTSRTVSKHFLIGDFNFSNVLWPESYPRNNVEDLFLSYLMNDLGHTQLIDSPTHSKGRTLDLLFTNDPSCVVDVDVLDEHSFCFSDHYPVSFSLKVDVGRTRRPPRSIRLWDKGDYEAISTDLGVIDWSSEFTGDINYNVGRFNDILYSMLDKYVPSKVLKPVLLPIWYGHECESARARKENLRKRWKTSRSDEDYAKFQAARANFKSVCNSSSRAYCNMNDSDSVNKKFWTQVNVTSKSTRIPPTVFNGSVFRSELASQADLFNEQFASNFSSASNYNIDIEFDHTGPSISCDLSASSVYSVLSKLNANKGPGPDNLHSVLFKRCAGVLAYPLSLLFGQAYHGGGLPDIWKSANVVPVHKSGDRRDVRNYRPISMTCIPSKIFERLITHSLLIHCLDKIDSRQHGFLPGRSCLTQLVSIFDDLIVTDNKKLTSDLIYFDFSKAFDSCNHDLILDKLKHQFNVNGEMLSFICNYLRDRTQRVSVGGKFSSTLAVLSGVPQGSILGPLLFVLFINDITSCVSGEIKIALYADDLKLWARIRTVQDHYDLQTSVDNLHLWSIANKMKFHPDKCKVISTRSSRCEASWGQLPCFLFTYNLGGAVLENVSVQRDLGLLVNSQLTWTNHSEHILSRFTDRFNLVRRSCHYIRNPHQRRIIFLTLVRSLLEHCSPVWAPHQVGVLNRLEAAQKRAVKWVLGVSPLTSWREETYHANLITLNILPIRLQFIFNDLKLLYKTVYNLVPVSLPDYLQFISSSDINYTTRSNINIVNNVDFTTLVCSIRPTTSTFRNGFFYRAHLVWNDLPNTIRQSATYSTFCLSLKKYLFGTMTVPPAPLTS